MLPSLRPRISSAPRRKGGVLRARFSRRPYLAIALRRLLDSGFDPAAINPNKSMM
jgi:hypothetical protein